MLPGQGDSKHGKPWTRGIFSLAGREAGGATWQGMRLLLWGRDGFQLTPSKDIFQVRLHAHIFHQVRSTSYKGPASI